MEIIVINEIANVKPEIRNLQIELHEIHYHNLNIFLKINVIKLVQKVHFSKVKIEYNDPILDPLELIKFNEKNVLAHMYYYHKIEFNSDQVHFINKMVYEKNVIQNDQIALGQRFLELHVTKVNIYIILFDINLVQLIHSYPIIFENHEDNNESIEDLM